MNCPLCRYPGIPFRDGVFLMCSHCSGIYRNKRYYVDTKSEIRRYEEHENNVNDKGYQTFVSPVTAHVLSNFTPWHTGLDFGSGTAPVISKILRDNGYPVVQYDPFFANDTALLDQTYDYIVSCEVIEHFHHPDVEFKRLFNLLNPGGSLICMTHLHDDTIDFRNWYYRNDRTHVFIYRRETIRCIAGHFGFTTFKIDNRLVVFNRL